MSQPPEIAEAPNVQYGMATRNLFVEPTSIPGSFMQPDPQPVMLESEEFRQGLDELAKEVTTAVAEFGPVGRQFR